MKYEGQKRDQLWGGGFKNDRFSNVDGAEQGTLGRTPSSRMKLTLCAGENEIEHANESPEGNDRRISDWGR